MRRWKEVRERGRWKDEVINWGDEEVKEFKRWEREREGKRGRWKGEVINWGDEKVREFKRWEVDEKVR